MDLGLADRAYIVTGGTGGLGRATAEVLVADGAKVVISSRSRSGGRDSGRARPGATGVVADNADPRRQNA